MQGNVLPAHTATVVVKYGPKPIFTSVEWALEGVPRVRESSRSSVEEDGRVVREFSAGRKVLNVKIFTENTAIGLEVARIEFLAGARDYEVEVGRRTVVDGRLFTMR